MFDGRSTNKPYPIVEIMSHMCIDTTTRGAGSDDAPCWTPSTGITNVPPTWAS